MSDTTTPLPVGWRRVESTHHPGEYYYVAPSGATTWAPPTASQAASPASAARSPQAPQGTPSPRRRGPPINSLQRQSYKDWGLEATMEASRERVRSDQSPSNRLHPKAPRDPSHFVSLSRQDFVPHKNFVPEPQSHLNEMPLPKIPFECNSTYRAEFIKTQTARVTSQRTHTPPKSSPFVYNSTSRAEYRKPPPTPSSERTRSAHGKRGMDGAKRPNEGFSRGTAEIGTLIMTESMPAALPPRRASQVSRNPIGVQGAPSCINSTYRSNFVQSREPARPHSHEAREYAQRAWRNGQNRATPDNFVSLYGADFIDADGDGIPDILSTCRDVDQRVKRRAQSHQELSEF